MSSVKPPPFIEPIADREGSITPAWGLHFESIYRGDAGADWTPAFVSLASTGTPTITGRTYRISAGIYLFRVIITPATNTSAVAGSTYISNLPVELVADSPCFATSSTSSALGACVASSNRVYVPAWTNIAVPVTITGIIEAT